jgi:predicted NBD/HSP70 family sugar kinase
MSLPTVMRVVQDLVEEGLVCFRGSEPSGGRRRPLLEFTGASLAVIAVDLGGTRMYGTLADLTGKVQQEIYLSGENCRSPEHALASLYRLIEQLLAVPRAEGQNIRGIGVGVPAVTLSETGTVVWAPSLGWRDLPLKALLGERFNLPVFVENDTNVATLGEYGFGAARGTTNLVCVTIEMGIGAGIMIDGKLYRGHHQGAGEVGYLLPSVQFLGQRYERFGALESLASEMGIAARARQLLQQGKNSLADTDLTAEHVFNYARQNEPWAQQVIGETVDYLTQMIAAISALLDPEVIVLGGSVSRSADLLIPPIMQRLDGVVPFTPRIIASTLGPQAVVMGVIMLVLDATTGHIEVNRRV